MRQSDVYVGIFGSRYGSVTASGNSVTEEEFIEARAQGKPILCFVTREEKESQQQAFLDRLGGYEEGYFFEFFDRCETLTPLVVRSLNDLVNQPGISELDRAGLTQHLDKYQWGAPRQPSAGSWLAVAVFPLRQGDPYISALTFDDQDFQDSLLRPARFGNTRLLDQELGAVTQVHQDFLGFEQRDEHRQPIVSLEFHTDGTIIYRARLGRGRANPLQSAFFRNLVIEEPDVQGRLHRFIEYVRAIYDGLDQSSFISSLGMGASLSGLANKGFGYAPSKGTNSMNVPQRLPADPVRVPSGGVKLARTQLGNPLETAQQFTRHFALVFRDTQAYYPEN